MEALVLRNKRKWKGEETDRETEREKILQKKKGGGGGVKASLKDFFALEGR